MSADPTLDPVFRHSRREALLILVLWVLSFLWTVPYCYLYGYTAPAAPEQLALTFGVPSWVWWGVAVPWIVCGVISIVLCLWFIRDDDLGRADDEAPLADEPV